MINKCCLNPQVNCFVGQCSYCNKQIEKKNYYWWETIWKQNVEIQHLHIGIGTIG
jgi:hypothetical protein